MARTIRSSMASIHILLLATLLLLNVVFAQNCGPQAGGATCQSGYCCSQFGYCGNTADYCAGTNCSSQCTSSPSPSSSGCFKKNNIPTGWLPDEDNGGDMQTIINTLGLGNPCYYGAYSQITSTTYDGSQLTSRMDDIKSSGAILQAAVMPTKVTFAQVTPDLANQIAAIMQQFTDNGVTVWLRFAHEMNYYVEQESGPTYAGGTIAEFITAWQNVANAVKGNSGVKMFWSPNNYGDKGIDSLSQWWPGPDYVDIVGIDIYPNSQQISSFSTTYGSFIDTYSTPYNKPFAVGETGATDDSSKQTWLKQLISPDALSSYPSYVGWSWFEYLKGSDFRIVTGPTDIAKPILSS